MAKKKKTETIRGRFILESIDILYKETVWTSGEIKYTRASKNAYVFDYKEYAESVRDNIKKKTNLTFNIKDIAVI